MKSLLTIKSNTYDYNKKDNKYNNKYIKIGDEKTWKVYIKK